MLLAKNFSCHRNRESNNNNKRVLNKNEMFKKESTRLENEK